MFAETINEVLFPVEKRNLYVRNNLNSLAEHHVGKNMYILMDSLTFVGECLINMEDSTVYKVGKQLQYTSTKKLIEQVLTEYGKFTTHIIYYSKDKSSTYINLILPEMGYIGSAEKYQYGLEIGNNYSGRFNPKITLSLYNIEKDLMIRTPISAFNKVGVSNLQGTSDINNLIYSKETVLLGHKVLGKLPKKYRKSWDIFGYVYLLNALDLFAEIVNKWLVTNYELATITQKEIYTILTNKGVEE